MPNFIKFYVKLQRQTSTYCKRSRQRQVKRHTMTFRSLTKLTSKDVEWQWGPEQQNAFQLLKDCLSSPPILCYADFTRDFIIHTDASGYGVGSVLAQIQGEKGKEKEVVISYTFQHLNKT